MKETVKDVLLEKLKDADLILVGIGEEFGISTPEMEKNHLNQCERKRIMQAYGILENLLKDKNYFVISTCMDDFIYETNLKKERIVTPCGGYRFMQCEAGCEKKIYAVEEVEEPICPVCGKKMVYNNINAENYVEEGYLEQWNEYRKWLQGTVNKKLCVLEFGVGMKYPSVIRWPFEKIVFFNQKSSMFRVHSKLYQLTEEIKDRGFKIEEKPIDFLINRFV